MHVLILSFPTSFLRVTLRNSRSNFLCTLRSNFLSTLRSNFLSTLPNSNHFLMAEPPKSSFFPAMTKFVGTLGPNSRSVETISSFLNDGMSVARFDFSWGDAEYHQQTLENMKAAIKRTRKHCAVMMDTVGPELQVVNRSGEPISLQADRLVVLTPDTEQDASSELLPINFDGLSKAVKPGDAIFVRQYLFTGSETTKVRLKVSELKGDDVVCVIKTTATLAGSLFTLHASQVRIERPTLSDKDKEVISTWGVLNKIDFLSLSYTRHPEDVRQAREYLSKCGDLRQTLIFAKIENVEGLTHFDEILGEADGIILSSGNLGIDLTPEQVLSFQKDVLYKCDMADKSALVTDFVDTMTNNLRPTRAEATDVATAVLHDHGTTVLAILLRRYLIFAGDGKAVARRNGVYVREVLDRVKVFRAGSIEDILVGQAGDSALIKKCKDEIDRQRDQHLWVYDTDKVNRVAERVREIAIKKSLDQDEIDDWVALVGGASWDKVVVGNATDMEYNPRVFEVDGRGVRQVNDYFCSIGSGSDYADQECAVVVPEMAVEDAVEVAMRAIFNAWRHDISTGGVITVIALNTETLKSEVYKTSIVEMQAYFRGKCTEEDDRKSYKFPRSRRNGENGGSYLPPKNEIERRRFVAHCKVEE